MSITEKFIEAGGIKFQYREAGENRKVIVFLHGAGGQSPKSARFPAPTDEEKQQTGKNAQANMARFASLDANADLKARLAEIKVPALLLVAGADQMIPEAAMTPYQELIPHCTRIIVYGAAHELPISAAQTWVKLVADFVDRGEYFVVNMG